MARSFSVINGFTAIVYVRKGMKANWISLVANVVDYVLLMLFWRVFGKPRPHRTVYLMSLCAWTGVLASRGSEAVLQLLLDVASRKKVVSLYSYVCWTNIHIRYDVCDWFRTFLSESRVWQVGPQPSSTQFNSFFDVFPCNKGLFFKKIFIVCTRWKPSSSPIV